MATLFGSSTGDRRQDEHGNIYWLDADQISEFDRVDDQMDNDDDFWAWFADFRDRHSIQVAPKSRRGIVRAADWFGSHTDWRPQAYSDYWNASKLFQAAGSDIERKLAIALQAVQTTVRVVDSHAHDRLNVRFAVDRTSLGSYTNFADGTIEVSPAALLDPGVDQMTGIDITTGFALHEASHAEYTRSIIDVLSRPVDIEPIGVASLLLNVLEDVRIERLTSLKFPGFTRYFDIANNYLWGKQADHLPTEWGPSLNDKINAIILAAKWHEPFAAHVAALDDAALIAETAWFHDWSQRYLANGDPRVFVIEALDHLALDPDTQQQLNDLASADDSSDRGESIERRINGSVHRLRDGSPGVDGCHSPTRNPRSLNDSSSDTPERLSDTVEVKVNKLASSAYAEIDWQSIKWPSGDGHPGVIASMRPVETDESRKFAAQNIPSPGFIQRMRSAFFFRPSAMEWSTRNLRHGSVDDDELWRAGANDPKFFEQRVIESVPDTNVTILIDVSGSMDGDKLRAAFQSAYTMLSVLRDLRGVRVRVRAHTAQNEDCGAYNAIVYDIWQTGDPISRLGLLGTVDRGYNFDGYAIGWCVNELMFNAHPGEQNVLFAIADGLPSGYGSDQKRYSGVAGEDHVRKVVDWAARNSVDVVSVAIDSSLRVDNQQRMFRHWLPFTDLLTLPRQLTELLKRMF